MRMGIFYGNLWHCLTYCEYGLLLGTLGFKHRGAMRGIVKKRREYGCGE